MKVFISQPMRDKTDEYIKKVGYIFYLYVEISDPNIEYPEFCLSLR